MFEGTSLAGFHRGNLRPRRTWFHSAATLAMWHRQALTVERWEDAKNNRERDLFTYILFKYEDRKDK